MPKNKTDIIQSILNNYKPDPLIKKIKCGFDSNLEGGIIMRCEFEIDKTRLKERTINKEKFLFHAKELANKIKRETKMPIKSVQTSFKVL